MDAIVEKKMKEMWTNYLSINKRAIRKSKHLKEAEKAKQEEIKQGKREKVPELNQVITEQNVKENLYKAFKWDIIREKRRKMLDKLNKLKVRSKKAKKLIQAIIIR